MRRFFIEDSVVDGGLVRLSEKESRHLVKVLRLRPGDTIQLLDGKGTMYDAQLEEVGGTVTARVLFHSHHELDSSVRLSVYQGLLKGKKMDLVVQKCTELGVNSFTPVLTSRCQGKLTREQGARKHDRLLRIIDEACKQCRRVERMALGPPLEMSVLLGHAQQTPPQLKLLFYEEEKSYTLHDLSIGQEVEEVAILLGPEGGFSPMEVELAREDGWRTVSLGHRILRAETATITAVSLVQFLSENL